MQPASRDIRAFYEQAAAKLKHPLLSFAPDSFPAVAEAFGVAIREVGLTCYACSVMPDHVHLVFRKHRLLAEEMIEQIQSISRQRLVAGGLRESAHPTWTRGGWKVFLDHPDEVRRTIGYVERNPAAQHWDFVRPYDDWPLYPGHSPNSPYARALRAAGRYRR